MAKDCVNQHKRMAMGQAPAGYARGGVVGAGPMVAPPSGRPRSPLTNARRNNGVPGMKKGGCMK
jgi:hypothetical protein